jgi:hypothetical protein
MIKLETARELKEAGLVWEPKDWDWIYFSGELRPLLPPEIPLLFGESYVENPHNIYPCIVDGIYWAPSLSRLLAEIEGRGYEWGICKQKFVSPEYLMELRQLETKWRGWAGTPEEAAAKALPWILRNKGNF